MTSAPGASLAQRVRQLLRVEVVRYGLVGVLNTAFGYGVFVALQLSLGQVIHYSLVQAIANLIAIVEAYWLQRWLVFRHQGNWWAGLGRFAAVYAGAFFLSLAMVALLVEVVGVNVLLAGAITVVVQAIGTYLANKWFTFRPGRGPDAGGQPPAGDSNGTVSRLATASPVGVAT